MFSWRNKKNILWIPLLIWSCVQSYDFTTVLFICLQLIDEAHPCYPQKYLRNKQVRDLKDEQFLRLVESEAEGLLTMTLVMDEETDNPNIQTYFEEIRQLYYRVCWPEDYKEPSRICSG